MKNDKTSITKKSVGFSEIDKIAILIAKNLAKNDVIFLNGDLGSGKTHFVKKICSYCSDEINVKSPTFGFYNVYDCGDFDIWHYDLYKLQGEDIEHELQNLDIEDALSNGVVIIEWSEKINFHDLNELSIKFFHRDDNSRDLEIKFDENSKWRKILSYIPSIA